MGRVGPGRRWVLGLDSNPFQPPSVLWTFNEGEPYEIRSAQGEELGTTAVNYRVEHHDLHVDLLWVGASGSPGSQPP
jgi:hypothetical protein